MKKLFTLLSALVLCFSLAVPTFASSQAAESAPQASATKAKTKKVKATKSKGKRHMFHARKKGATKGKKTGQASTPSPSTQQ
jgi:hypothetical protein